MTNGVGGCVWVAVFDDAMVGDAVGGAMLTAGSVEIVGNAVGA